MRRFRYACRARLGFQFPDEKIAAAGNRFDIPGVCGGVAQDVADLLDRGVEAIVEIHESLRGPQLLLQFLAGNDLAGIFQEHLENLKGLTLQFGTNAVFSQFTRAEINFEPIEAQCRTRLWAGRQSSPRGAGIIPPFL